MATVDVNGLQLHNHFIVQDHFFHGRDKIVDAQDWAALANDIAVFFAMDKDSKDFFRRRHKFEFRLMLFHMYEVKYLRQGF